MYKKCNKYEGLFTFADEETLKFHLSECSDCRKEQEKMDRVSELLKEVRPYYIQKRKQAAKLKIACVIFSIILCTAVLGIVNFNSDVSDIIKYGNTLSAEDLGFPVDSYGLLMVE